MPPVKSEFVTEETEYFLIHIVTYFHHRLCSGEIEGWARWQLALLGPRERWPGLLAMHTAGCLPGFCAIPWRTPVRRGDSESTGPLTGKSDGLGSFLADLTDLVEVYLPSVRDAVQGICLVDGRSWHLHCNSKILLLV